MLGGPPTPGIGFGSGIERLLMVLDATGSAESQPAAVDVYVAAADEEARQPALRLAADLRSAGISADVDFTSRSLRAQMREASRLGARLTALIGEDEMKAHQVTLRDMQTGEQETISRDDVVRRIAARHAAGKDQG
jgi:histidyl-tRNA synthetase